MQFGSGRNTTLVLNGVDLQFEGGRAYAIMGPSGSGKTTLLSILGCMCSPTRGEVWLDSRRVNYERKGELISLRRQSIGFVFQHAQLLPFLTIEENLSLVGRNSGMTRSDIRHRLSTLLRSLSIHDLCRAYPSQASGGERQRAAIARALLHRPKIILADEPTAALDWANGRHSVELLVEHARRDGAVLVIVTHDQRVADLTDNKFKIDGGRISPL